MFQFRNKSLRLYVLLLLFPIILTACKKGDNNNQQHPQEPPQTPQVSIPSKPDEPEKPEELHYAQRLGFQSLKNESSHPEYFTSVGNKTFFIANDKEHGTELWVTDGTPDSTMLVKDIYPGAESGKPTDLTSFNGKLYFRASSGSDTGNFWVSDGTESGTHPVFKHGEHDNQSLRPYWISKSSDYLFLLNKLEDESIDLWRSDGTAEGTLFIKNVSQYKSTGVMMLTPSYFTGAGNKVYFTMRISPDEKVLWSSDGTETGTDIIHGTNTKKLTEHNGDIYFVVDDNQLWKSDGTIEGTDNIFNSSTGDIASLTSSDNSLFFTCNSKELWVYNPDQKAPVHVKTYYSIKIANPDYQQLPENSLFALDGHVYFGAKENTDNFELWRSDGSATNTVLLNDISIGHAVYNPSSFSVAGNSLYFTALSSDNENQLWKFNPSTTQLTGVSQVIIENPGYDLFAATPKTVVVGKDGNIIFSGNNIYDGFEVWFSDGTKDGTYMLKNINTCKSDGTVSQILGVDGKVFFGVNDGPHGLEFHVENNNSGDVHILKDIAPGVASSNTNNGNKINIFLAKMFYDNLFFIANNGHNGPEYWVSDGTVEGTKNDTPLLQNMNSMSIFPPGQICKVSNSFFYTDNMSKELWVTNEGTGSTIKLTESANYKEGDYGEVYIHSLTNLNNKLLFIKDNSVWVSNGTEAGTICLSQAKYSESNYPGEIKTLGNFAIYTVLSNTGEFELWRSDGTVSGTVKIKTIGNDGPHFISFYNSKNVLFFSNDDGLNGRELWKTDGTQNGTCMVRDINPGGSSFPSGFTDVNGTLFFTAFNNEFNEAIWKTDGTDSGTVLAYQDEKYTSIYGLINSNGELYFHAKDDLDNSRLMKYSDSDNIVSFVDGINGPVSFKRIFRFLSINSTLFIWELFEDTSQLWFVKDGLLEKVTDEQDLVLENIDHVTGIGNFIYFSSFDKISGRELWKIEP